MKFHFEELSHSLTEEFDRLSSHIEKNKHLSEADKLHIADLIIGLQSHVQAMQESVSHILWLEKRLK